MSNMKTLTGEFVSLRPLGVEDAEMTLKWRQSQRAINLNQGAGTWPPKGPGSVLGLILSTTSSSN